MAKLTYKKPTKNKRITICYIVSFFVLLILFTINISNGSSEISLVDFFNTLTDYDNSFIQTIIFNIRLPHVLCSILSGAILGICGCMLQSTLSNALAAPSTIGVSQGASCGACIAILFGGSLFSNNTAIIFFAFIFALIPVLIIIIIYKWKKISPGQIILLGIAMSMFFSGVIAILQYFADPSKLADIIFWTFGSVYNTNLNCLFIMLIIFLFLIIYSQIFHLNFNAFEWGDSLAHNLGINVNKERIFHVIVVAISCACVTSFCGTINFIGLIAPHIIRKIIGGNYKNLIPLSAITGANILTISDILSSTLLPGAILPIGAVTSIIGVPIFAWILIKNWQ